MEIAVQGTIDGLEDGPTVLESESGLSYPDLREPFALVRVKVDATYRLPADSGEARYVYVALSRGVEVIDENGQPVRPAGADSTVTELDTFAKALPVGTRVMIMGERWTALPGPNVQVKPGASTPADAILVRGGHPQSFALEIKPGGLVSGWKGYTFEQLVQETKAAAGG
ncbi:hypothetical protein [Nocardioides sp. BYT-33-1]|uniref:hypothetical protein n=1 Tax=Nocardioides sp. BYT-33-1 TaxID=3416952 RepID=UPI003F536972